MSARCCDALPDLLPGARARRPTAPQEASCSGSTATKRAARRSGPAASGTLRVRDRLDLGRGDPQRVTGLRVFRNGGLETVTEALAGQVVVLRGLNAARIGDGFGPGPAGLAEQFARPSLGTVVEPLDETDRPALYAALDRLAEQDPLISLRVDGRRERATCVCRSTARSSSR